MEPVVIALPGSDAVGRRLASKLGVEVAGATFRRFPDGEDYVRLPAGIDGRDVVFAATMHPPAARALPLLFAADTARDLGARRVGLVAPYLAYMRQDHRFRPGEGVTSAYFARMISSRFDWLVTVDPHLHRWASLDDVYSIPSRVVPAAPDIATWLVASVSQPFIIGPDAESAQWVRALAELAEAPYAVLEKTRRGDRDVSITGLDPARHRDHTPVLVDDIISTAGTMLECLRRLECQEAWPPLCIGTHAVFTNGAFAELGAAGVRGVVTCNTIEHPSNGIDVLGRVADAAAELLALTAA